MKSSSTNHHYVSQAEQRLNSIDPSRHKKRQRIYAFSITNREEYEVELDSPAGVKIENNLSHDDLYSFDEFDSERKYSLEGLYGEYEREIGQLTKPLVKKVSANDSNISDELIRVFVLKVLNSFRNPYCIKKTLNTFGSLGTFVPTDEAHKSIYEKIERGADPTRSDIAATFGVSEEEYVGWMKSLFNLLAVKDADGVNIVESMLVSFFADSSNMVNIYVNTYSGECEDKYVALSDRGFTILTDTDEHTTYEFNLSSNSFITYVFTDIRKYAPSYLWDNQELIERIISGNENQEKNVRVHFITNNLKILDRYNKNVVYQSHAKVFCKGSEIYDL
ncbi:hypothetical protein [Billgrantia desiderata]|uniref:hypothetical protein n=1 Tax=Billgrantia desiderata TaxID=52021 RepID=UPI00089E7304|nr:hypothetical protein [Halomonas desiderata]SEF40661.1 hypothetical protein SAMN04487953_101138 [Halomonas desiderata]